jgi:hypothetical protein
MIGDGDCGEIGGMNIGRGNRSHTEKNIFRFLKLKPETKQTNTDFFPRQEEFC